MQKEAGWLVPEKRTPPPPPTRFPPSPPLRLVVLELNMLASKVAALCARLERPQPAPRGPRGARDGPGGAMAPGPGPAGCWERRGPRPLRHTA